MTDTKTDHRLPMATNTPTSEGPENGLEGAEALCEALLASGVEIVFGYTGGAVSSLTRKLFTSNLRHMGARTEISAAWMSYGYNRAKRRAASGVISWAVGALHASPVMYAAKLDGTPLLLMAMDNPPALDARDMLQDAGEMYSVMKPISKYIKKVVDAGDLPVIVRQAVKEASTGRFGPSFLDLAQPAMFQKTTMKIEPLVLPSPPVPSEADVAAIWELLSAAERPVLYVGAGVHIADAAAELGELAELLGVPVVTTSAGGRGVLPDLHPLHCGPSGSFGWRSANDILQRSDLWVSIGLSFSQMSTGTWTLQRPDKIVHVDIDQREIAKIIQPTLGVQADAKAFLQRLLAHARKDGGAEALSNSLDSWRQQTEQLTSEWQEEMDSWAADTTTPINQYHLIRVLSEQLPADTMMVGDSGAHAFALYRAFRHSAVVAPPVGSRYQSLGAGLPVAIGAKLADPERTVVCYHGDGGFYYDFSELSNLAQHDLKVIVVLDNNGCLLANRSAARARGILNPWADLPDTTDFVTVAKGLGVAGERVDKPEDLPAAIQRALESPGSYLLDVRTDPELRLVRAISGMIPIVGDRIPKAGHLASDVEGSWPN